MGSKKGARRPGSHTVSGTQARRPAAPLLARTFHLGRRYKAQRLAAEGACAPPKVLLHVPGPLEPLDHLVGAEAWHVDRPVGDQGPEDGGDIIDAVALEHLLAAARVEELPCGRVEGSLALVFGKRLRRPVRRPRMR